MYDEHQNILDGQLRQKLARHPQIQQMEDEHERMREGRYTPRYHYYSTTPTRKLNDPNGLCCKDGVYHMFYQQWPQKDGPVCWGHAISRDMIRWTELHTAIAPGRETHVYSGTTWVEEDRVLAIYHGVGMGNMIAQSTDEYLVDWERICEDAVLPIVPTDADGLPYRVFDPCIWKEEDGYYALSGTFAGGQAKLLRGRHHMVPYLFRSDDLKNWRYAGVFMPHNPFYSQGEDCACPYFIPFGGKHMLMHFSHTSSSHILVGDYDRERHIFTPSLHQPLAVGEICSAAGGLGAGAAMADGEGGAYAIFNLKEGRVNREERDGVMTLPWHMTLDEASQTLRIRPYQAVESLRQSRRDAAIGTVGAFETRTVEDAGNSVEIDAQIDMGTARAIVLQVLCSKDGREHTDITVTRRPEDRARPIGSYPYIPDQTARVFLSIDSIHSSLSEDVWPRAAETLDTVIPIGEPIRLRAFIDVSTLEVFLNDRLVLSQSVYPTQEDATDVRLTAIGGDVCVQKLDIWQMQRVI